MFRRTVVLIALLTAAPAHSNAWEDNFTRWLDEGSYIEWQGEPERLPASGDIENDLRNMYRRGFVAIGHTLFNSPNDSTRDAMRWGEELGARFVIAETDVASTRSGAIPITTPNSTTSITSGTASVFGSNGSATGNYSGTTTTVGSQTNMVPFTVSRFDKFAIYFAEEPQFGAGIYSRTLTDDEMRRIETRRAFVVRFVRDASPAYFADILPGDVILRINGQPADPETWWREILDGEPDQLDIDRGGKARQLTLVVPEEWRSIPEQP